MDPDLIDFDFSANNGGWQWCASTGADSAPYFRIFNPLEQSKKYDSRNEFINKYIANKNYPAPIIDYKSARQQALKIFRQSHKK